MLRVTVILIVCVLLTGFVFGCDSKNSLAAFQPEIANNADNFQFQATEIQNVSTVLSYSWSNSGTRATVDHSSVVNGGSASVSVFDSNDSLVYSNDLIPSGNHSSDSGAAGNWRIVVQLTNLSGTLNFRAQKL